MKKSKVPPASVGSLVVCFTVVVRIGELVVVVVVVYPRLGSLLGGLGSSSTRIPHVDGIKRARWSTIGRELIVNKAI